LGKRTRGVSGTWHLSVDRHLSVLLTKFKICDTFLYIVNIYVYLLYLIKEFIMKNSTKWFGIIALIAVIGFSFGACGDGSDPVDGKKGVAPTITTVSPLPGGTVNTLYTETTLAATGTAPITWSLDSDSALPTGLDLATNGVISGTPSADDTFTFTVIATNSFGSDDQELTITIAPAGGGGTAPAITTVSPLPGGTVGTAYSQALTATGTAPITWSLDSGTLPTGLNVVATGAIEGTPTVANTYTFTVRATNAAGSVTKSLSIAIAAAGGAPTITTVSPLPGGTVGKAYSKTLAASGTATITWSLDSGTLPTGLNLYGTGVITGTPTAEGPFTFTVKATNPAGSVTKQLSITIIDDDNQILGIEMVPIQAGTFMMGSPTDEPERYSDETEHLVTLTTDFRMSKYLVTQGQYEAVMGSNPSAHSVGGYRSMYLAGITDTANFPVECVNWYAAIVFCNKLSMQEDKSPAYRISGSTDPAAWGTVPMEDNPVWNAVTIVADSNGYRLPTEAQWEYACRAGTTTAYNTGAVISVNTGWWYDNSINRTHRVGEKLVNEWGLYDMHGNVYELCWDWSGAYLDGDQTDPMGAVEHNRFRMIRGGSYSDYGRNLRSAMRFSRTPFNGVSDTGFRVVLPVE
jgi:formylglycine-generating enzyme required for sulfatase activity